jgi:gliding motility-associated-like protein
VCGGTDGSITLSGLTSATAYNVTYFNGATVVGPVSMTADAIGDIIITGLAQGTYTNINVSLNGCNTTEPGPITLSDPNSPVFNVTSTNPTVCGGSDGTLTLTGLTANTAYNVTYLNGATTVGPVLMTSNASGDIVITGLSQGTYSNVNANLTGCSTTVAGPFTLTDPNAPVFTSVAANPTTCGGSNGTITLSGLTPNTSYNVGYLNGATLVGPAVMSSDGSGNIVISNLGQGSYSNITVNLSGCTTTDAGPYVIISPTAPNAPSATGASYCSGAAINSVTATGTGGTFNWYDDAALTVLLSSNATYTPTTLVTHTYYVTETVGGCTSPATPVTITINTAPAADAGNTQLIGCGVSLVSLDGSLSASGASIIYNWTTATGTIISNGSTTVPTVGSAGTYTITVTDNSTGCIGIDSVVVTGSPSPVASFTADPATGTHPLTVNFTNTSQNANTYIWDFGDGFGAFTIDAADIYVTPGTYTVSLIASDNLSCPDTAYATVVVLDDYTLVIPNIFTPNSDGINDQFKVLSTGAESLKGAIYDRWGLKIYDWANIAEGWDGHTSSGVEVSAGTYYYILNVKGQDGKEYEYTGFVQLLR